jgi:peptide/nickel transport system substrate-binding protein
VGVRSWKAALVSGACGAALIVAAAGPASLGAAAQAAGKYGGTLTIEIPNDPPGLDPATVLDNDAGYVLGTLYDGLTAYAVGSTKVVPGLATSWKITNGGKTYIFNLRHGVTFSDGTPFNAQAVAEWINHLTNPKNPDYYAKQKGISTFVPFTWGNFKSYKVLGPYQIEVNLSSPNGEFLADLAMVWDGISSPTAVAKYGVNYYLHPSGTGPFVLKKWVRGQYVEVTANPHYWGGKPYLQNIIFDEIPNPSTELLSLRTGKVQILTDVAPNEIAEIKNDPNLRLIAEPGLDDNAVSLPVNAGPFKNVLVRRALNYAVNKAEIDKVLYGGLAHIMNSPLPTVAFGYDKNLKAYPYDPSLARKLLKEAGYPHGFSATMLVYTGSRGYNPISGPTLATAIQSQLAAVGVKLKLDIVDPTTWLAEIRSPNFNEMTLTGWTGDNGDPDDMISPLFNGNAFATGNSSHYNNPQVNKWFAEALETSVQSKRAAIYTKIQEKIMSDAPWIFLDYTDLLRAESTQVHGFVPNPTFFYVNMNRVWLSH